MKRLFAIIFALAAIGKIAAQISPENYSVEHKDSNWYVTLDYEIDKIPAKDGMLLITHLCNEDTCISSAVRHFQGKNFAKQYVKRHGYQPNLHNHGNNQCVIALPEKYASDTLLGITYCEYNRGNRNVTFTLDTMEVVLPGTPPLSCHKVDAALTIADHIAQEHPYVKSISHYTPINESDKNTTAAKRIVRYRTASPLLDVNYMNNAQSIEDLMSIINQIIADSTTTVEAVQLVGYTSPEGNEQNNAELGYKRALALRDHIRSHHHLHDSVFEIADGGRDWQLIYKDIAMLEIPGGDSLIARLKKEPSATKREIMLHSYDNGHLWNELSVAFAKQRGTSVNAIYYHNRTDSAAVAINEVVNELINNPAPDYRKMAQILRQYKDDARALNLQGVIDYRRHRLHAAEQAFEKAAAMGDEQAATNLLIVQREREDKAQ